MPFSGGFRVASPYGLRTDPITGEENVWHGGIDLVSRAADGGEGGAEVLAVFPGVVLRSRIVTDPADRTSEWGNYVSVLCDDGLTYYYCHLAGRLVSAGELVDASRPIGIEGSTGRSTGIHLHLEIRGPDGETLDPAGILGIENRAGFVFPPAPASDQAEPWRAEASGWSEEAVDWAVRVGILKGRGNGNYALKDPITREEMCVMMHRLMRVVSWEQLVTSRSKS